MQFLLGIEAGLSDAGLQFLMVGAATDAKCTKAAIMEATETTKECHPAMDDGYLRGRVMSVENFLGHGFHERKCHFVTSKL